MSPVFTPSVIKMLRQSDIFEPIEPDTLRKGLEEYAEQAEFLKGEVLRPRSGEPAIGLLISGKAAVTKGRAVINTLEKGALFGAVTLYAGMPEEATRLSAMNLCRVVFLPKPFVSSLMKDCPRMAENYIAYLSRRIYFLTDKIDAFTAGCAENRLSLHLLGEYEGEEHKVTVGNFSALAKQLDISRATLYRALDNLEKKGAVIRNGKIITVTDKSKLF